MEGPPDKRGTPWTEQDLKDLHYQVLQYKNKNEINWELIAKNINRSKNACQTQWDNRARWIIGDQVRLKNKVQDKTRFFIKKKKGTIMETYFSIDGFESADDDFFFSIKYEMESQFFEIKIPNMKGNQNFWLVILFTLFFGQVRLQKDWQQERLLSLIHDHWRIWGSIMKDGNMLNQGTIHQQQLQPLLKIRDTKYIKQDGIDFLLCLAILKIQNDDPQSIISKYSDPLVQINHLLRLAPYLQLQMTKLQKRLNLRNEIIQEITRFLF